MLCALIFIHEWRDLQFKVDSERQIFYEMAIYLLLRAFTRNRRRNTFRILFWCLAWGSNPGFVFIKPTHYLLDHGDSFSHGLYNSMIMEAKKFRFLSKLVWWLTEPEGGHYKRTLKENRQRNIFFHISFWCLTWYTNPGFTSYKPIRYLLDCGDFHCNNPIHSYRELCF